MAFKKRAIFPPLIIVGSIVLFIVLSMFRQPPQQTDAVRPAVLVEAIEVEGADVRFQIESQGTVQPRYATDLVTEVSGRIVEVSEHFVAGGFFDEGDELLRIDPSDYEVALQEAKAQVAQAQAQLEEELALAQVAKEEWAQFSDGEIPALGLREPQVASAAAMLESARASLAKAERDLERTVITAPFSGLLQSKSVDRGQFVSVSTDIGRLLGTELAEVRVPLSDRDLMYLDLPQQEAQLTQEADVLVSANIAGETVEWMGKLVRSEGVLNENSRVIYGVVEVQDPYNQEDETHATPLRFGRYVQTQIAGNNESDLYLLPRYALNADGTVWLVTDDRTLEAREVTVRRTSDNNVYVGGGLKNGDRVMLTRLANPLPGMTVRLPGDPLPELEDETSEDDADGSSDRVAAKD